jgi:hypothetical protein
MWVNGIELEQIYHGPMFRLPQAGADPGFQVRGDAVKKIAPSGGRREICWVFRVKIHDFTPKNHIFSNFRGEREIFGVFHVKKAYFFQF